MADKIAGIDVHKKVLLMVVMDALRLESKPERRRFVTISIKNLVQTALLPELILNHLIPH